MNDEDKSKSKLITELEEMRQRIAIVERSEDECKRAEQALRGSEEFNSSLLNNSPMPIVVVNPDSSIRYVNPALENLTGFTSAELTGRKFPFPWWTKEKIRSIIKKTTKYTEEALLKEERKDIERRLRKNGEEFWVELTSKPVMRDGEFLYHLSYWVDITERRRAEKQLERSHKELANLSRHLQTSREEERTRIAREIHDEMGQMLVALKIDLAWLTKRIAKDKQLLHEKAKSMSELIDLIMQSVKRISSELRPRLLDDLGITAAIEWQAQEFQKTTGINFKVICDPEDITLDPELSTIVFRIFQETLTNIFRHANATKITVRLIEQGSKIVLKVRDNGKGIAEEDISDPKGIGLIGMRERAYSRSGRLQISGVPGKGTTVTLAIPLNKETKADGEDIHS